MISGIDISFMQRALNLAELGRGRTSPNPMVGAVIVQSDEVIGEGYHKRAGADHAEVAAIKSARKDITGATVYVTLEPCCHQGRTGPCTEALIKAGVSRVVMAALDPSAKVNGGGAAALREAGIEVALLDGAVAARARAQNEGFRKHAITGLPFVTFKSAMSLDGKIATKSGDSRWISGEESRALVHAMRAEVDAVAVGGGTALIDDPMLTCRLGGDYPQPLRVVFDSGAGLPLKSNLVKTAGKARTMVIASEAAPPAKVEALRQAGVEVMIAASAHGRIDIGDALTRVGSMDPPVLSLLLEGGSTLAASFVETGAIDKVMMFVAPKLIGGESAKTPVEGGGFNLAGEAMPLFRLSHQRIGEDVLIIAYTAEEEW